MTGKLFTQPGKRGQVADILLRSSRVVAEMPGCRAYIVLEDAQDESVVWVFEMWDDKSAHDESLKDARVRALITEAMPLLGGAPQGSELRVLGGYGVSG